MESQNRKLDTERIKKIAKETDDVELQKRLKSNKNKEVTKWQK